MKSRLRYLGAILSDFGAWTGTYTGKPLRLILLKINNLRLQSKGLSRKGKMLVFCKKSWRLIAHRQSFSVEPANTKRLHYILRFDRDLYGLGQVCSISVERAAGVPITQTEDMTTMTANERLKEQTWYIADHTQQALNDIAREIAKCDLADEVQCAEIWGMFNAAISRVNALQSDFMGSHVTAWGSK